MWGLEGVCRASSLVWTGPEKREGEVMCGNGREACLGVISCPGDFAPRNCNSSHL